MSKRVTCRVCGHNMTEGPLTADHRRADLFFGQEVNPKTIRREFREIGMKTYIPDRDKHQCLAWDPEVITMTKTGWTRFHFSGEAEDWKFGSPARGLIWGKGYLTQKPSVKIAAGGWWALNSWGKDNAEGPARRKIVETTTLPVVKDFIRRMHKQDRTIIMEADANNVRWNGSLPGMTPVAPHLFDDLDRAWVSTLGGLHVLGAPTHPWLGERTGVGPDHQHKSLNFFVSTVR